jgi:hypothetical protein
VDRIGDHFFARSCLSEEKRRAARRGNPAHLFHDLPQPEIRPDNLDTGGALDVSRQRPIVLCKHIFAFPSFIFTIEYVLQIPGRSQRLKETLIWVPISVHRWIIYVGVPFWLIVLIFTDLILAPAKYYTPTGWEHGLLPQ